MSRPRPPSSRSTHHSARDTWHAIGKAPARGLATGIAMVRVAQIARLARRDSTDAFESVEPAEFAITPRGDTPPVERVSQTGQTRHTRSAA
jgi:hypothetical protein